jgi:hypothetical protein
MGFSMARKSRGNVIMNDEVRELATLDKPTMNKARFREVQFSSLAEKIAGDKLYYKNYYYPGGRESFMETRGQTVDKFFPYAEGGPLFVDEVSRLENPELFEKKTKMMEHLGHRYVAILPGMSELDIRERLT